MGLFIRYKTKLSFSPKAIFINDNTEINYNGEQRRKKKFVKMMMNMTLCHNEQVPRIIYVEYHYFRIGISVLFKYRILRFRKANITIPK